MNDDLHNRAAALIANALGIDPSSAEFARLGETKGWDSIAHMRLILAIEEVLEHQLEPETIISLMTFEDVVQALSVEP